MSDTYAFRRMSLIALCSALACHADAPLAATRAENVPTPASQAAANPNFLAPAPGAPALAATTASLYAVNGQDREVFIWFHAPSGAPDSTKLVRFRVTKKSLCNRPNGTPIAKGDSVLISLTVTNVQTRTVTFAPSGLTFCSGRPAKLAMWYLEADHDFDHDGDMDAADAAIERTLRIWKQENTSSPWLPLTSVLNLVGDQLEADVAGFTSYVVAY